MRSNPYNTKPDICGAANDICAQEATKGRHWGAGYLIDQVFS